MDDREEILRKVRQLILLYKFELREVAHLRSLKQSLNRKLVSFCYRRFHVDFFCVHDFDYPRPLLMIADITIRYKGIETPWRSAAVPRSDPCWKL